MNISNNIYKASRPLPTHWRKATCQEVDCEQYLLGWQTIVDITTDLGKKQYNYIVNSSGRKGSGNQKGNLVTFTFHMNISSASLDSGALKFGGLPFTPQNVSHTAGGMWKIFTNGNIDANATYKVIGNATDVQVITAAGDAMAANATSINSGNRHMAYWGFYYV